MARARYVWRDGKLIERGSQEDIDTAPKGPMIISDEMEPTRNPIDGRIYESRSAYYRVAKERGYLEVGNEKLEPPKREESAKQKEQRRRDIAEVLNGYGY